MKWLFSTEMGCTKYLPGHFRFSQDGEAILQLDAKLFFTHRGIEIAVEGKTPEEALLIVERICGACSVANTLSYC